MRSHFVLIVTRNGWLLPLNNILDIKQDEETHPDGKPTTISLVRLDYFQNIQGLTDSITLPVNPERNKVSKFSTRMCGINL